MSMQAVQADPAVNVLWTGGWDSTYRVLSLVLEHHARTQPIYVVDPSRPSSLEELRAMAAIRRRLGDEYAAYAALLLPTQLVLATEVPQHEVIEQWHGALQRRDPTFPNQYNWLARYAEAQGIAGLELCVHRGRGSLYRNLHGMTQPDGSDACSTTSFRLADPPATPELGIFRRFRFPLLELDKVEMGRAATAAGFDTLLELTWFCHCPRKGRPCGGCGPCRQAADEGLKRRIPWTRRVLWRYLVYAPLRWQEEFREVLRPRRRLHQLLRRRAYVSPA